MQQHPENDFLKQLKERRRSRAWLIALAWTASIYVLAIYAYPLARFLKRAADLNFIMIILLLTVVFFFICSLFLRSGMHKTRTFLLTLSAISIFVLQYFTYNVPAKQYHLIEYSVLSYLLYDAFRFNLKSSRAWLYAFLGAALVSLGDEGLQQFIPGRFPTASDLIVNLKGAAFGLMFAAIVEIEKALLAAGKGREP